MSCPAGPELDGKPTGGPAIPSLAVGTGSGTEVSSLTTGYRRSRGRGTEKALGQLMARRSVDPSGLASLRFPF